MIHENVFKIDGWLSLNVCLNQPTNWKEIQVLVRKNKKWSKCSQQNPIFKLTRAEKILKWTNTNFELIMANKFFRSLCLFIMLINQCCRALRGFRLPLLNLIINNVFNDHKLKKNMELICICCKCLLIYR